MVQVSDIDLELLQEYASLLFTIDEIALMLDCKESELRREVRNKYSEVSRCYHKGKLLTQVKLRKQTKLFAEKGSPQAEQNMKDLYQKQLSNE